MEKLHPLSIVVYFIEALVLCFYEKTAGLGVLIVLLMIFAFKRKKAKNIVWALPLALFMMLLNPLFNHSGATVLFSIRGINFTLEALENGLYSAMLIICTILIFTLIGCILDEEKFLYVFGRFFPKISLMVSMIFRHFDLLGKAYSQTREMAQLNGCYNKDDSVWKKLKTNAVIFEAFTGTALEGSIETGLSLVAKGYYSKDKTRMKKFKMRAADYILIAVSSVLFGTCFIKSYFALIPLGLFFLIPLIFSEGGGKNGN